MLSVARWMDSIPVLSLDERREEEDDGEDSEEESI